MRRTALLLLLTAALAGSPKLCRAQAESTQAAISSISRSSAVKADSPATSVQNPDPPGEQLPIEKLEFKSQPPIPGAEASPAFVGPIVCSPDGIPFVDFLQPPDYMRHVIYSLDPKGGHGFSPKAIPGLYDVQLQSYFASNSILGILIRATADDKKAQSPVPPGPGMPPAEVYVGAHQDYLAEFDKDGNFKQTVSLPPTYHFWRMAQLSDDTLLALAYDKTNSVPRLFLLDSKGEILHTLEIPARMKDSPQLKLRVSGDESDRVAAQSSLSSWLFAPARDAILLYQAHSTSPLLEVRAGGVVREVPLETPKAYSLDGVISANDRWILRYRRESLDGSSEIDAKQGTNNYVLYEVSPSDGSLRAEIDPGSTAFFGLACEQNGVVTAFSTSGGQILPMTASLPN